MFNQQRLQLMHLGVHHNELTDAYLYAWYNGVYPAMEDTDGSVIAKPHEAYSDFFTIKKSKVLELLNMFDDDWKNKSVPTFYELEDRLKVNYEHSQWDRSQLLKVCRYFYLQNVCWGDEFWNTLITPMQHPTEAGSITRALSRDSDIYFI
ncbi:MAG: antitoxin MazE [Psychromonas sp.]|jgi:antitoxin MazE